MSDTNRIELSYIKEVAYGVTPAGNLKDVRLTSDGLGQDTRSTRSQEIRKDRQIPDIIRTGANAGGEIGYELSYGAFDDFMASTLGSAGWSTLVTIGPAATISAAAADQSFNDSANGFGTLVANQWVKVSGFVNAVNNGLFKILTKAAGKITVQGFSTLINESVGPSVTVKLCEQIVNGVVIDSYSFERKYSDLSNVFSAFVGEVFNRWTMDIANDQIIKGVFGLMGKKEESKTATIGTGYVAAPSNDVMAAIDGVVGFLENALGIDIITFGFVIDNAAHGREVVAKLGPQSMGEGTFGLTGTLKIYHDGSTIIDKHLTFLPSSIVIQVKDSAGQGYVFEIPSVKYTAGKRPVPAQNQDVVVDLTWEARRKASEDIMMRIARFA